MMKRSPLCLTVLAGLLSALFVVSVKGISEYGTVVDDDTDPTEEDEIEILSPPPPSPVVPIQGYEMPPELPMPVVATQEQHESEPIQAQYDPCTLSGSGCRASQSFRFLYSQSNRDCVRQYVCSAEGYSSLGECRARCT